MVTNLEHMRAVIQVHFRFLWSAQSRTQGHELKRVQL
jgi:hypothetical protein